MDLGRATTADGTDTWFTTVANAGFDAEANRWANGVQRISGTPLYVLAALRTLRTSRPRPFVLRLDDGALAEAKRLGAKEFEPMPGRAMQGWIILPARLLADDDEARRWIERARSHVSTMPAKRKKKGATKR